MISFSIILSPLVYGLLAFSLLLTVVIVVWHVRRYSAVRRCVAASGSDVAESLAPATVVVYAHNDGACLKRFLPYLLNQNYPNYEVIVVNDSSVDNSAEVISEMIANYDKLR